MNEQQKYHIQQLAQNLIRYSFTKIKAQTDREGKHLLAYYFSLVDDFFAAADNAITREDRQAYNPQASILYAIWSGRCYTYEGSYEPVKQNADNWLDNQSYLYKETYQIIEALGDDDDTYEEKYEAIRKDFEECLLRALQQCDAEGVFGNRLQSGLVLFAFYVDDYDKNGKGSMLYRSAQLLNPQKDWSLLIDNYN